MRILQTIPYMLASQGGPSTCTRDLLQGLLEIGADVNLLTSKPLKETEEVLGSDSSWIRTFACDYRTPLAFSNYINYYLHEYQYDIYHANTLWLYPTHATCQYARKKDKPYIVSPHGMLYPTALAISRWKKRLMERCWFRKDIMKANCIHATCVQEMKYCREYGYKGPIAVIPNPVIFPKELSLTNSKGTDRRKIGFLGRLHPIKNVENLIYAISLLKEEEKSALSLQIMGKFDDRYENWLKSEVVRLRLEDYVNFVGFVTGKEKYDRLSELWCLMVPSAQENFGMIVPEALICGVPVYASLGTPWQDLNTYHCGWWKDNSPNSIAEVMRFVIRMSLNENLEMGQNGYKLIQEKYEQHKVARMMYELYSWIMEGGTKPNFVYEE